MEFATLALVAKEQAVVDHLLGLLAKVDKERAGLRSAVNAVLTASGEAPMFSEVEEADTARRGGRIAADAFFGKPLATAAKEIIERNGEAMEAKEILSALEAGGFDFSTTNWKPSDRLRSLAISLAKNNVAFVKLPNGTFGVRSSYPAIQAAKKKSEAADTTESTGEQE